MLFATLKMSQYHQFYDYLLTINCNNQKVERALLCIVINEHFQLYTF